MLKTKLFYEIMEAFEDYATKNLRLSNSGLQKEEKKFWENQVYYTDGELNNHFKTFLYAVQYGRII